MEVRTSRTEEESLVPLRKFDKISKSKQSDGIKEEEYSVPNIIVDASSCTGVQTSYKKGELLGTGGFAKVYKVTEISTGTLYADKIISMEIFKNRIKAREKVQMEICIHRKMDHPNVVQFYKCFEDRKFVHMIMEICSNRTLLQVLKYRKTITEPEARYYLKQIMEGTRYLHLSQVLHRDLKLGNMFLHADMTIKIGDFGLACTFSQNKLGSMCGTPNYIAPEVLSKKGHAVASDIWAIGCMLFAMLCGYPPFETESLTSTYKKIASGEFNIPEQCKVSDSARDMIEMMLCPDPDLRGHLSMPDRLQDELDDLFLHPFLREFTPSILPSSAINTPPNLEDERRQQEAGALTRSSAMSITGRRPTNEDPGCGSFSPIFSPPGSAHVQTQMGVTLKQKFGNLFQKQRFLHSVVEALTTCVELGEKPCLGTPAIHSSLPVFVTKWVDYSNKFGFGYQLSSNSVGLLFNDSTKIGCTGDRSLVEFCDLKGKNFTFPLKGPIPYKSQDLSMRVGVLGSVIDYMERHLQDSGAPVQGLTCASTGQKSLVPQLKRYCRRTSAVTLELNNHTIQINHLKESHTKVVIFETGGALYLTLLDKNQKVETYSLASLVQCGSPPVLLYWLSLSLPEVKHLAEQE